MFSLLKKTAFAALLLSCFDSKTLLALATIERVRTLPAGAVEFTVSENMVRGETVWYTGSYRIGAAISERIMAFYAFDYIQHSDNGSYSGIGDSLIGASYYIGGFRDNSLHLAVRGAVRLPTGPSAYATPKTGIVAHGIDELNFGLSLRYNIEETAFHIAADYIFRQEDRESFYSRQFFSHERFRNDSGAVAAGVNSSILYPVVPFAELRTVFPVRRKDADEKPRIAGGSFGSFDLSAGLRFFLTREFNLAATYTEALLEDQYYFDRTISIEASILF